MGSKPHGALPPRTPPGPHAAPHRLPHTVMKTTHTETTRDGWAILRRPWRPAGGATPTSALACRALTRNADHASLARIYATPGGFFAGAEQPPLPDAAEGAASLLDEADRDIHAFETDKTGGGDEPPQLHHAEPAHVQTTLAALRQSEWTAEIKSGGRLTIPLGGKRRATGHLGVLDGTPAVYIKSLESLPDDPACKEAAILHSLLLAGSLRLARPCLATCGGMRLLAWLAPLPDPGPAFLDHALGALAAVVARGLAETRSLSTDPDLASRWLDITAPWANQKP